MQRPSFHQLTAEQQRHFGNGVGPFWFPANIRNLITRSASWFFDDASWRYHDFGYAVGGDRWDRLRCDWKFFLAMLRDALSQNHQASCSCSRPLVKLVAVPSAIIISCMFFLAVRLGGQFGSFQYRDSYASLVELKAFANQ